MILLLHLLYDRTYYTLLHNQCLPCVLIVLYPHPYLADLLFPSSDILLVHNTALGFEKKVHLVIKFFSVNTEATLGDTTRYLLEYCLDS